MNGVTGSIRRYTPSGSFSPTGVVLTLIVGAALMVPAAFVYCLATRHIPIVYVNFIATYIFGAIAGFVVVFGAKRFGIRNTAVAGAMGFVLFAVGYAAHWPAYVAVLLADWSEEAFNVALIAQTALELVREPDVLMELLQDINMEGTWSVGKSSQSTVSGMMLSGVWVAEALLILFAAVSIPVKHVRSPYSERRGEWIKAEKIDCPVPYIENVDAFMSAMSRHDYAALTTPMPTAPDDPGQKGYAKISLYPDDRETYVSVTNVLIKRNKKGKQKSSDEKNVVEFMTVDNATAAEIRDKLSQAAV